MRQLYLALSFFALLFAGFTASAQNKYTISGTVVNAGGQPLTSATVFLSESESITMSNETGHFRFDNMSAGSYRLVVTMVGYSPYNEDLILTNKSETINVVLALKHIELKQVNIGGNHHAEYEWNNHYELFKTAFLGLSHNGRHCVIKNPKIIYFSTKADTLLANADDFLIIENPRLGYRIKYLLKYFSFNTRTHMALYNGEINFDPMTGTPSDEKKWKENRFETYKGSLMHWLRSVYQRNTQAEGFIVNSVYNDHRVFSTAQVVFLNEINFDARQVNFDTIARVVDNSFVALKFNTLYISYNPKKAALQKNETVAIKKTDVVEGNNSLVKLYGKQTLIDRRGAHSSFRDFFLDGQFGHKRVGDQLPYEYQPPANTPPQ